jgi:stearoyl-CoA desaturase (delta-9 desaturase)
MGILTVSWLQWVGIVFVATHITIIAVTLYLHRSQAHRALDLNKVLCHFFRLWLWLTTGMNTREWVAVHRKHHAHVETKEDPHSPKIYGIWQVLFNGVGLYRRAAADPSVVDKYGAGTPNDWLEHRIYSQKNIGVLTMLSLDILVFGWGLGAFTWVVQMLWIPLLAAGVINGVGHYIGYRNYQAPDESKNIVPWGLLVGGEELHNNHHAFPRSAKFSSRAFEFDLGYVYIQILSFLKLAKVNYVLPNLKKDNLKGIKGILNARMGILSELHKVIKSQFKDGLKDKIASKGAVVEKLLNQSHTLLGEADKKALLDALALDEKLDRLYQFQMKLHNIFYENRGQDMLDSVKQWCEEAKGTHQKSLVEFAHWVEERFLTIAETK